MGNFIDTMQGVYKNTTINKNLDNFIITTKKITKKQKKNNTKEIIKKQQKNTIKKKKIKKNDFIDIYIKFKIDLNFNFKIEKNDIKNFDKIINVNFKYKTLGQKNEILLNNFLKINLMFKKYNINNFYKNFYFNYSNFLNKDHLKIIFEKNGFKKYGNELIIYNNYQKFLGKSIDIFKRYPFVIKDNTQYFFYEKPLSSKEFKNDSINFLLTIKKNDNELFCETINENFSIELNTKNIIDRQESKNIMPIEEDCKMHVHKKIFRIKHSLLDDETKKKKIYNTIEKFKKCFEDREILELFEVRKSKYEKIRNDIKVNIDIEKFKKFYDKYKNLNKNQKYMFFSINKNKIKIKKKILNILDLLNNYKLDNDKLNFLTNFSFSFNFKQIKFEDYFCELVLFYLNNNIEYIIKNNKILILLLRILSYLLKDEESNNLIQNSLNIEETLKKFIDLLKNKNIEKILMNKILKFFSKIPIYYFNKIKKYLNDSIILVGIYEKDPYNLYLNELKKNYTI